MLKILSLGAGVQSTVMALLAARGDLETPDYAIFSDTGWEPQAIYQHLDWLETKLPFPLIRVSKGNIKVDLMAGLNTSGGRFASIPYWVKNVDGSQGLARRQCTREYKIDPISKKIRELLGLKRGQRTPDGVFAEVWIGISTDEAMRMKPSRDRWSRNRWPLIEERMSRGDCYAWWGRTHADRPLIKSACIGCPYTSNEQWRMLKARSPEEWGDAIAVDEAIRAPVSQNKFDGQLYIHRSLKPLAEVDIGDDGSQPDLFNNECEGMCGV